MSCGLPARTRQNQLISQQLVRWTYVFAPSGVATLEQQRLLSSRQVVWSDFLGVAGKYGMISGVLSLMIAS
jgi:hypothetical protein